MTMHIAIDLDDVILDFMGGVRAAVATEFGVELVAEDMNKWEVKEILDPIIGRSWWSWLRDREWLWANFPAMPGAIGTIERLRADGHYLEIVTSKPRWAEHNTWKWVGKWRPAVQRVTIVGIKDSKADATEADILIDDKPQNIEEWVATNRHAILFTRPHNHGVIIPIPKRYGRTLASASDWSNVYNLINYIQGANYGR